MLKIKCLNAQDCQKEVSHANVREGAPETPRLQYGSRIGSGSPASVANVLLIFQI